MPQASPAPRPHARGPEVAFGERREEPAEHDERGIQYVDGVAEGGGEDAQLPLDLVGDGGGVGRGEGRREGRLVTVVEPDDLEQSGAAHLVLEHASVGASIFDGVDSRPVLAELAGVARRSADRPARAR